MSLNFEEEWITPSEIKKEKRARKVKTSSSQSNAIIRAEKSRLALKKLALENAVCLDGAFAFTMVDMNGKNIYRLRLRDERVLKINELEYSDFILTNPNCLPKITIGNPITTLEGNVIGNWSVYKKDKKGKDVYFMCGCCGGEDEDEDNVMIEEGEYTMMDPHFVNSGCYERALITKMEYDYLSKF